MFLLSNEFWEVRETHEKGKGVFAKKAIQPGVVIGDYIGKLVADTDELEEKYGLYEMYFNNDASIFPDIKSTGIHLINHSCAANSDMFPYMGHMLYFTTRHIFPGEELTVHYALTPPEKNHVCNHICYCHTQVCSGTMHVSVDMSEKIDTYLEEVDGMNRKVLPVPVDTVLPRLPSYPSEIPDQPLTDLFANTDEEALVCTDTSLPSLQHIREMIRKEGRVLNFTKLHIHVLGVMNGLLLST